MTDKPLDNQTAFTKVKEHLLKQMEHSYNEAGECAYRGENGLMCAIGCLIPDKLYKKEWEGKNMEAPEIAGLFPLGLKPLLYDLQNLHDVTVPIFWEAGLQRIAKNYKLEY